MEEKKIGDYEALEEAVKVVQSRYKEKPEIGIILGSGLGALADKVINPVIIPYGEIPNMPVSNVPGHAGKLYCGQINGVNCIVMSGRVHSYEGHAANKVVFGARLLVMLGCKKMIITNAAGGINPAFKAGDLMVLNDHINNLGVNPLRGTNDDRFGVRFPDMSTAYNKEFIKVFLEEGAKTSLVCHQGVYVAMPGPSYETPAEVRMLGRVGGDAVGMSTVPEVIAVRHMGAEVLSVSCITNLAAGVSKVPLSHEEVKETADRVREPFVQLVSTVIGRLAKI